MYNISNNLNYVHKYMVIIRYQDIVIPFKTKGGVLKNYKGYFINNIVKETAKELGMTQKELAIHIGVSADTVSKWSRGVIQTPKWTLKMFELLKIEREFILIKKILLKK